MQRRLLLAASVGALATAGCQSGGKVLGVTIPPNVPPPKKIERILIWFPPQTAFVDEKKLDPAFVSAFAPYGVTVRAGRSTALELNRGEDQASLMNELKATHRLEIEVAYSRSSNTSEWILSAALYAGTGRTPLLTLLYRPSGFYDDGLVRVVMQELREHGYL
jgi:hypothetical protein